MSHYRVVIIILCFSVFLYQQAHSEQIVTESAFCLDVKKSMCLSPLVEDKITLSSTLSAKNQQNRIYFWSKINTDEHKYIMHVWRKKGSGHRVEPAHLSWSSQIENLSPEVISQTNEKLELIRESASKIQGVILSINKSPGFRTYSSIITIPGKYSVGVYDLNGKVVQGGDPKSVEVSP